MGKHFMGLPTLSTGGAGARFGVCAKAGDEMSMSAKAIFLIPTSLISSLQHSPIVLHTVA